MTPTLKTIDAALDELTLTEQLLLMESLARRIRSQTLRAPVVNESDLAAMANDPDIQRELKQIETEFSVAEADGLVTTPCDDALGAVSQRLEAHLRAAGRGVDDLIAAAAQARDVSRLLASERSQNIA